MKSFGLLAAAALLLGASAPVASAEPAGPLIGAEMICANQGGTWHPNGFPTFPQPTCAGLQLIVWNDQMESGLGSNQLTAATASAQRQDSAAPRPSAGRLCRMDASGSS